MPHGITSRRSTRCQILLAGRKSGVEYDSRFKEYVKLSSGGGGGAEIEASFPLTPGLQYENSSNGLYV